MQTREQVKNWKVIGSLAAVAALGVSGLAVANASEPTDAPPPIEIDDQRSLDATVSPGTTTPSFVIVPAPSVSMDDSLDSPLASGDLDSVDDAARCRRLGGQPGLTRPGSGTHRRRGLGRQCRLPCPGPRPIERLGGLRRLPGLPRHLRAPTTVL